MAKESLPNNQKSTKSCYFSAKGRCQNPNNLGFHRYGGRGIEFRFKSFEEFHAEMGDRPTLKHSIDRIDNDGHYESGNVRWATQTVQARNTSTNRLLTYNGDTKPLAEWADVVGMNLHSLATRMRKGWCVPCALFVKLWGHCSHQTQKPRNKAVGERAGSAKLTSHKVLTARAKWQEAGRPTKIIVYFAKMFGVSYDTMKAAIKGESWKHI